MIYRACGVFKSSYESDAALFPVPLTRNAVLIILAMTSLIFPLIIGNPRITGAWGEYLLSVANLVGIASVGALGLNILTGYTGQISIGHGAFMSVGAYTAAVLATRYHMPFWVCLPAAGAMAALVGSFFGIPSLRIKGLYLAIATLAAQFIIEWTINHVKWISGGVQASIYVPKPSLAGHPLDSQLAMYFLILIIAVVSIVFALNLFRSPVGRAFVAIRDHDVAAEIIGINIFKYKLAAFAISSFYAGVAGALYTYHFGIANYEQFTITTSIEYLAMIIIGGLGSVLGSIFGAMFITLLPILLDASLTGIAGHFGDVSSVANITPNLQLIIFGSLIVLFLIIEPEGLNKLWRNIMDYFRVWPYAY